MEQKQIELDSCNGRWRIITDVSHNKPRLQVFYNGDVVNIKLYDETDTEQQTADFTAVATEIKKNYYVRPKNIYDILK